MAEEATNQPTAEPTAGSKPTAGSNIKRISQATGEFISDDSSEPGYQVSMDDPKAQEFIDRIKAAGGNQAAPSPVPSPVIEERVEAAAPSFRETVSEETSTEGKTADSATATSAPQTVAQTVAAEPTETRSSGRSRNR